MSRARDLADFASDSQINAGEIEDNAVTTAKIADSAITVAKIGDGAVHNVKLANSTIIMSGDSGSDSVALGETMTVAGGTGITSTGSSNTITIAIDSTVATLTGTQTLTNKTISGSSNTLSNIANSSLTNSSITVTDGSTSTAVSLGGTITIQGTTNEIEVSESSGVITVGLPSDTTIGNNLTIAGDLTVNGTTTTLNTTNTEITDNLLELNSGVTSNANDSGIIIERGSTGDNAIMAWDESADAFVFGTTTATASDTGNLTITAGDINVGGLTVDGNATVGTDTAGLFSIKGGSSTSSQIRFFDGGTARARIGVPTGTSYLSLSGSDTLTADVVVNSSGNVGIGTTSPTQKLDIDTGYLNFSNNYGIEWGTSNAIRGSSAGRINFRTAGSERMRIDGSGNVGIGTTSPSGNLVVQASAVRSANTNYNQIVAENNGNSGITILSGTTSQGGLVFGDADSNNVGSVRYNHSTDEMVFDVNGSRALTVNSSLNFGLSTSSPSGRLHIQGISGSVSGLVLQTPESSGDTNSIDFLNLNGDLRMGIEYDASTADLNIVKRDRTKIVTFDESTGRVGIGTSSPSQLLHLESSNVTMRLEDTDALGYSLISTTGTSDLQFKADDGNNDASSKITFDVDGSERMRITSSGDVGIGTTGPDAKLDVKSQINITNSNNVSLPAVLGSEYGYSSSYKTVVFGPTGTTTSDNIAIGYDPSINADGSFSGNGSELLFRNGISFITPNSTDTDYYRNYLVLKDGSVGIGTTSPQDYYSGANQLVIYDSSQAGITIRAGTTSIGRLHFADGTTGNEAYRGYIVYDHSVDEMLLGTSGSTQMVIESNGNVGIGETSPSSKLDVNGTVTATAFSGDGSSLTGISAGITEADQWRLSATKTSTGVVSSNLERVDTDGGGYLGTGMSESSGVFTFPGTGIWLIILGVWTNDRATVDIESTTDGSSYGVAARIENDSSLQTAATFFMFDVTSTSTHKIRFNSSGTLYGNTSANYANFTFIRLGDT